MKTVAFFFAMGSSVAHSGVIPQPAHIQLRPGEFPLTPDTVMRVPRGNPDAEAAARYLVDLWARSNGRILRIATESVRSTATHASISFRQQRGFGPEGYGIDVTARAITVRASTAAGLFYGAVTLWQLLPPGKDADRIPAQTIHDAPSYAWRGLMLDSARHFQSPAFIRAMIDWMSWHKLNVLHWHLTDDQGWRLESAKYPRLTSVGAWRIPARIPGTSPGARYGGFYTRDEVRNMVKFAATRHVQIVPEIDLPGHATAAIAAYPELGAAATSGASAATGAPPLAVAANWGVLDHLFNLEPATFRFLEDVLGEVLELFPSPYIHIGGDEVVTDEWQQSATVQARARELGIHDTNGIQPYFTQRISRYLTAHGRRAVGWDEIQAPGLAKNAVVMSWHGLSGAHLAAIGGHDTVLSPAPALYFDHRQSTLAREPAGRTDVISLEEVYRFDPRDAKLTEVQRHHVLGVQADLWTEHMPTEQDVQWMALPRAAALAELGWSSPERRSWPDFLGRLMPMMARYRVFDLNYADSVYAIDVQVSRDAGGVGVRLSNQAGAVGKIRYTLDGSDATARSTLYAGPFIVPVGTDLHAAAFIGAETVSPPVSTRLDARAWRRRNSRQLELCSDEIGLLLQPVSDAADADHTLAIDIMNPCWMVRGVDLTNGPPVAAAVAALPFNFEIGAGAAKIRVGDAHTADGEFEVHADSCDSAPITSMSLPPAPSARSVTTLPSQHLPRLTGRHDLCLRFARPRLDPQWGLDWVEIGE